MLLTFGLIWLFILAMIIVRQEEGDLHWATVKRRLWLDTPRAPQSGEPRRRLWLWLIPFLIATIVWELALTSYVDGLWVTIFPFLAEPPGSSFGAILESPAILARLVGAWWFLGLFVGQAGLQHDPGRGVSISGRAAAQDGERIWQVELDSKRCTLWLLSCSPAMDYSGGCH